MHAVILVILNSLFILVCRSKSPTGLMLQVVQYSTQNRISMCMPLSMSNVDRWSNEDETENEANY